MNKIVDAYSEPNQMYGMEYIGWAQEPKFNIWVDFFMIL